MAVVYIANRLEVEIHKKFKKESVRVIRLLLSLEDHPKKGDVVGSVGGIIVKEVKYKSFRFYCVTDGYKVKFLEVEELKDLVIKFVRMSDKRNQQEVIDEIKSVLRLMGDEGF